ncbi:hypothetical protein J2N86_08550 [Legionella lytica]|uniref:Glycine zipper 2TM domain-containing protein n=1 Tax=Legionella lytica TaxID=96232 RepID=A0ABY4Y6H3_9GAMM|nr:hypothetical protein [Legionella lytica]USQ12757.1 hypothetical protein J2N86_08550 [Legionella lytica]
MKKLIITSSALLAVLSLSGCNTMNTAGETVGNGVRYTTNTVGNGIKYGVNTVGNGVRYGAHTVGQGVGFVGNVVGSGVGLVTGKPVTYQNKVVYHNGHKYVVRNGRYVLVR